MLRTLHDLTGHASSSRGISALEATALSLAERGSGLSRQASLDNHAASFSSGGARSGSSKPRSGGVIQFDPNAMLEQQRARRAEINRLGQEAASSAGRPGARNPAPGSRPGPQTQFSGPGAGAGSGGQGDRRQQAGQSSGGSAQHGPAVSPGSYVRKQDRPTTFRSSSSSQHSSAGSAPLSPLNPALIGEKHMGLAEIEKRMTAIVKGVLSGSLHPERLVEVTGPLWTKYVSGPYPSISAIHDARLQALVEMGQTATAIAHYEAHPDVAWSASALLSAARAARLTGNVHVHAEVLVRLEELGRPIDFNSLAAVLETCIMSRDVGRAFSLLPRLAMSGLPLPMHIYRRIVETACSDTTAFRLSTGGFSTGSSEDSPVSFTGPLPHSGLTVASAMPERAVLALRELVRARRMSYGPAHGLMSSSMHSYPSSSSSPSGGVSPGDSGAGGGAVAGKEKDKTLTFDRVLAERTLDLALRHDDGESATIAYHCARELGSPDLGRREAQMQRMRAAARIGAPALAEAILVDMLAPHPAVAHIMANGHGEIITAKLLSSALNHLTLAYCRAGDITGAARGITLLHEVRHRWLLGILHNGIEDQESGRRDYASFGLNVSEAAQVLGSGPSAGYDWKEVSHAREVAETLACMKDPTTLGPHGGLIGLYPETSKAVSAALLTSIVRMHTWEKALHARREEGAGAAGGVGGTGAGAGADGEQIAAADGEGAGDDAPPDASVALEGTVDDLEPAGPDSLAVLRGEGEEGDAALGRGGEGTGAGTGTGVAAAPAEAVVERAEGVLRRVPGAQSPHSRSAKASARAALTQPLLASYGLAATLLGLPPESATPEGFPRQPAQGAGAAGDAAWPADTEALRTGAKLEGLSALAAGYSIHSFAARLVALGAAEAWSMLHGTLPWPPGGLPVEAGAEGQEEGAEPVYNVDVEVAAATALRLFPGLTDAAASSPSRYAPAHAEGKPAKRIDVSCTAAELEMGPTAPWVRTLHAAVHEAHSRIFSFTSFPPTHSAPGTPASPLSVSGSGSGSGSGSSGGAAESAHEGDGSSSSSTIADPARAMAAARVDVSSLSLSSQLYLIHGGPAARLPYGTYQMYDAIKATLGLPRGDIRAPLPRDMLEERPTLPPPLLAVLMWSMASSQLRSLSPALLRFCSRVLAVPADADCYAALLAAHAYWKADTLSPTVGIESVRALRDTGLSPNGAVYGELAYLLARLGRYQQAVATLEAGLRKAQELADRMQEAENKFAGGKTPPQQGATRAAAPEDQEQPEPGSGSESAPPVLGVTGVHPTPLPSQAQFERVVRVLARSLQGRDVRARDRARPDWFDNVTLPPAPSMSSSASSSSSGQGGQGQPGEAQMGGSMPAWRRVMELMEEAGYAPTFQLRRALQDHLGVDRVREPYNKRRSYSQYGAEQDGGSYGAQAASAGTANGGAMGSRGAGLQGSTQEARMV